MEYNSIIFGIDQEIKDHTGCKRNLAEENIRGGGGVFSYYAWESKIVNTGIKLVNEK